MAQALVHPQQQAVPTVALVFIPPLLALQAMLPAKVVLLGHMAQALAWLLQRAAQTVLLVFILLH
jgi:hypothetical protein